MSQPTVVHGSLLGTIHIMATGLKEVSILLLFTFSPEPPKHTKTQSREPKWYCLYGSFGVSGTTKANDNKVERTMIGGRTRNIKTGYLMVGVEGVLSILDHEGGKIFHDRSILHMEIAQRGIRVPEYNETNDASVHVRIDEGHSPGVTKRSRGDVLGK